jgi:hypothetical protein
MEKGIGVGLGTDLSLKTFDLNFRIMDTQQALPIIIRMIEREGIAKRAEIFKKTTIKGDSLLIEGIYPLK